MENNKLWVSPKDKLPDNFTECVFIELLDGQPLSNELGIYSADSQTFNYWDAYADEEVKVPIKDVLAYIQIPIYEACNN